MDITIAGGGMAGATLALALAHMTRGQLKISLIEAADPLSSLHPGYDSRAIAIAEGTRQQLENIAVWEQLCAVATPLTSVHVSDRGHAGRVSLYANEYGVPALGQVVELHEAGERLFSLLRQTPGVHVYCPARVVEVQRDIDNVTVTLDTQEKITSQLLVAADGATSPVAGACGITWHSTDYQQVAVIANVTAQQAHQGRAWERFTPQGPLALLPMSDGRCSLVWCHPQHQQAEVESWDDSVFLATLQQAFGWRLGRFLHVGKREYYPLVLRSATQRCAHRLALVGNAAQTLHPIAGQGFNLGLRDVMSLAETVAEAWHCAEDVGSYGVLQRYQQRRQPDAEATIAVTDTLVRLFANRYTPLVVARNLGLIAMQQFSPARHWLAKRTLGWVER